ncbi:MAG: YqzL family protein [Clostridiales bacterium]|nr:YqzL family protein [Clostridiales bacterium]
MVSEFFWKFFETTGSLKAYVLYKELILS